MHRTKARRNRFRHALVLLVVLAGAGVFTTGASAHDWSWWHWDRGGSYVPIYIYNTAAGSFNTAAENARADIHRRPHPLYLIRASSHTDVSVFSTNEPGANYCGLAEIVDWRWWTPWTGHILHAHARYNTACGSSTGLNGYVQGVYCQEIGHALGLDHSNTGDCMGLSYFAGSNGRNCFGTGCDWVMSHPAQDLYNKYRFH